MRRRKFIGTAVATGLGSVVIPKQLVASGREGLPQRSRTQLSLAGLERLQSDCHRQLVEEYLPFWKNGGIDEENGGFMCYLKEDGTLENDRKDIWYQGRGVWVYATLYNELNPDPEWLDIARKAAGFMAKHMHRGDGTWIDTVDRYGKQVPGIDTDRANNVYGALFAAVGLIQLARATGSEEYLELAKRSIRKAVEQYEDKHYPGVVADGVQETGLRTQGHSFMMVWVIPQLLELENDAWFVGVLEQHLDHLQYRFWNPDYGISNEDLFHDYTRIPAHATRMVPGHSIEAQWMCLAEAMRKGDSPRVELFSRRIRRLIEMSWDYPFGGTCDTGYHVFPSEAAPAGAILDIKTMWAQCEGVIGCLMAHEYTGEEWAGEWFGRCWDYLQRTMTTPYGVWRQAVDRLGNDKTREGISVYRRGNFHQPRCLIYMIQMVRRLIARRTPQ